MASTASAGSLGAGPAAGGNGAGVGGGMDELLPLVLQLTNAESVSVMSSAPFCCDVWLRVAFEGFETILGLEIDPSNGISFCFHIPIVLPGLFHYQPKYSIISLLFLEHHFLNQFKQMNNNFSQRSER